MTVPQILRTPTPITKAVGTHLLADLHGIPAERLRNEQALADLLKSSLTTCGYHILSQHTHKFTSGGEGVTGIALLSESHASFHSYPEQEYLAFDLFSCGAKDPQDVLDIWKRTLAATDVKLRRCERG